MKQHFLALHDFNEVELYAVLLQARQLKAQQKQGIPPVHPAQAFFFQAVFERAEAVSLQARQEIRFGRDGSQVEVLVREGGRGRRGHLHGASRRRQRRQDSRGARGDWCGRRRRGRESRRRGRRHGR